MKSVVFMAMAFGLASANISPRYELPPSTETCECDTEDLCYQAVHAIGATFCDHIENCQLPSACADRQTLQEACTCVLPTTTTAAIVSTTETASTEAGTATTETATTEAETATTGTTEVDTATTETATTKAGTATTETETETASQSTETATGVTTEAAPTTTAPAETNTTTEEEDCDSTTEELSTGTETATAPTGTETAPTETAPTGTETETAPVNTKTKTEGVSTTEGSHGTQTTEATVPYTTKTVYTTAVHTYSKCPDYVKDCPYGTHGPYTVTETVAVSTTVCPVTEEHPKPTGYTTKTVYSTEVYTISKCPPSVKDCPYGSVTTKSYPVSTTVCPITEEHSKPTGYAPPEYTTKTVYSTKVYTVTKCGPEVKNCPYGSVTTETVPVSTTVCPVTEEHPAKPTGYAPPAHSTLYTTKTAYLTKVYTVTKCGPEVPNCPYGSVTTETVQQTTVYATGTKEIPSYPTVVVPKPEQPQQPEHPAQPEYPAPKPEHPETPAQPEHPAKPEQPETPSKPEHPAYPAPPAKTETYKAPEPSQPSATLPYHAPTGTAPAVEVTAGASRFGVEMAVAAAGIFAVLL
ncbi:hypothetical protein FOWG_08841 [Fusarium oxysporum f. sp. lycopersici MN25]|nr:hypothetical protein FOWG_08841 [Fusarium oxysporum f. sp. lycopersici MN25]